MEWTFPSDFPRFMAGLHLTMPATLKSLALFVWENRVLYCACFVLHSKSNTSYQIVVVHIAQSSAGVCKNCLQPLTNEHGVYLPLLKWWSKSWFHSFTVYTHVCYLPVLPPNPTGDIWGRGWTSTCTSRSRWPPAAGCSTSHSAAQPPPPGRCRT